MASGIIKIKNKFSGTEISILPTDDIEGFIKEFESGNMPTRGLARYPYKESLCIEVIEVTENLAERYAYYSWPCSERISYSKEIVTCSLERGFGKKIRKAVDWLVCTYRDKNYHFDIDIDDKNIIAIMSECGKPIEKYTFTNRSGEPTIREILN